MPKANARKSFEWDAVESLGFVEVTSHKQIEVLRVWKDGKEYVLLTELKYFRDQWNPVKGMTMTPSAFIAINNLLLDSFEENPPQEEEEDEDAEEPEE